MKRILLLSLSLLFFASTMQAQVTSSDELIHQIFASLKAKDENAFLVLCPDSAQLVQIMKRLAEGVIADIKADLPKDLSASSLASFDKSLKPVRSSLKKLYSPKGLQRIKLSFREKFRSIINDGEKRGVDWTAATFTNYTFDSSKYGYSLYGQSLPQHSDFRPNRGKIYFKDKDSTCQIWFSDLLYIPGENKWYAGTLEALLLGGDDVVEVVDVVVQSILEELPPPPPPPKPKKGKTSAGKKKRPPKS